MEVQIYVVYCFLIASPSLNAFTLLPSFFDSTPTLEQHEAYDTISFENEIPVPNSSNIDLLQNDSFKENVTEPASLVLSRLRLMLDSPYQDIQEYAAKKAKELTMNLEHNTNKFISFTLGGVHLLVDLGTKGGQTRLRNVNEAKSLMEYFGEIIAYFASWVTSWFVTESNNKDIKQDHKRDKKENAGDSMHSTAALQDGKAIGANLSENGSEIGNKHEKNSAEIDPPSESTYQVTEKHRTVFNSMLSNDVIFTPPKELSAEEKDDVEKARHQIITIQKAINELENEIKQNVSDETNKSQLMHLKDQVEIKIKFIKLSTSERIR